MPNASAPKAPWVEVWLSPQTIVFPGCVRPSSGPITWTMPSLPDPVACSSMPNSSQLARSASSCAFAISSVTGPGSVGTLWSIVATVSSGRRTRAAREPQPLERLRRGDLVHEVQVDVEQRRLTRLVADDVPVPDLVEQAPSRHQATSTSSTNASASASIMIGS